MIEPRSPNKESADVNDPGVVINTEQTGSKNDNSQNGISADAKILQPASNAEVKDGFGSTVTEPLGLEKKEDEVPRFIKEQTKEKSEDVRPEGVRDGIVSNATSGTDDSNLQTQASHEASVDGIAPLPAPIAQKERVIEKKKKIIWRDALSCWVLGMGMILIVLVIGLFLIVKSGILNIPYLSDWFYDAPLPTRYVEAGTMSWDEFRDLISVKLTENNLDNEPPIPLDLSEKEFTAFLHGVITGGLRNSEYRSEVAQVVILPESVEMYFYLTWHDYITFEILTHLAPIVEDNGTLRFEVIDAKFGDLPLPGLWVIRLIGYVFARDVGVWRIILSNGYGIQSSVLSDQSIKLLIGPVVVE
ncbi:MAG: hypothetical protein P1P90_05195 [Patescibacteria group bacterium]|nr:hypothetical protein [Patescibacteria group bacterium]